MRIDAYNQINQLYRSQPASRVQKTEKARPGDGFTLSSAGRDFSAAKSAASASPDIREDVVGPIRDRIRKGTYDVSAEDFADKLLEKFGA